MSSAPVARAIDLVYELAAALAECDGAERAVVLKVMNDKVLTNGESRPLAAGRAILPLTTNAIRWPAGKAELAEEKTSRIVTFFGQQGGQSSISKVLKHLEEMGLRIDRQSLTTTLNRMCKPTKTSSRVLLAPVPERRGWFKLTSDGHAAYSEGEGLRPPLD